ncbi:hypothetical protein EW093_00945 [Thiospirochaeta perfilievii]|uniref:Uncharacterized protein n=1 Tax=Thiospirochaeta perfilievii TaxID=252967 RepID=A0A5C1Q8P0_9SPIO|nr:hypothetical protein [Thiospirochaeta perfilievii]QEN03329.1 hypothetical protein EW093_00945 [Thiospirochaeta perfilievii]
MKKSFDHWSWALNAAKTFDNITTTNIDNQLVIATIGKAQSGKTTALVHLILDEDFYTIDSVIKALRGNEKECNSATPVPIRYIPKTRDGKIVEINSVELESLTSQIAHLRDSQKHFVESNDSYIEIELPGKWRRKDLVFIDIPGYSSNRDEVEAIIAQRAAEKFVNTADIVVFVAPGNAISDFGGYKGSFEYKMKERIEVSPQNSLLLVTFATELANDTGENWTSTIRKELKLDIIPPVISCSFKEVDYENIDDERIRSVDKIVSWMDNIEPSMSKVMRIFSTPISKKRQRDKYLFELNKLKSRIDNLNEIIKNQKNKIDNFNNDNEKIRNHIKLYKQKVSEIADDKGIKYLSNINWNNFKNLNHKDKKINKLIINETIDEIIISFFDYTELTNKLRKSLQEYESHNEIKLFSLDLDIKNFLNKHNSKYDSIYNNIINNKIKLINNESKFTILNRDAQSLQKLLSKDFDEYINSVPINIDKKFDHSKKLHNIHYLVNRATKIKDDYEVIFNNYRILEIEIEQLTDYPHILKEEYIKVWNKKIQIINKPNISVNRRLKNLTHCYLMSNALKDLLNMRLVNMENKNERK